MSLIVKDMLLETSGMPPECATNIYINVPKRYLSKPYGLPSGVIIFGKVLDITTVSGNALKEDEKKALEELKEKDLKFVLGVSGRVCHLLNRHSQGQQFLQAPNMIS